MNIYNDMNTSILSADMTEKVASDFPDVMLILKRISGRYKEVLPFQG